VLQPVTSKKKPPDLDQPQKKRRMPVREPREPRQKPASKAPDAPSGTGPRPGETGYRFELPATTGETVVLADLRNSKPVVLFFLPKLGSPGSTREAQEFQAAHTTFRSRGVALLGISIDSSRRQAEFAVENGITYPLLADEQGRVAAAYGAYALKTYQGRSFKGVIRSTFLLDRKGVVRRAWNRVHVQGHVKAVLQALDELKL
jgi:peroxiredoxin Q/BCP